MLWHLTYSPSDQVGWRSLRSRKDREDVTERRIEDNSPRRTGRLAVLWCVPPSEFLVEGTRVYTPIARAEIADRLVHLRNLFRTPRPTNGRELRAHEKREAITRNLLSNLVRTKEHPTLRTILDVAEIFSLTLDGAHRLFGYDLDRIREYDLRLNGGRTHIIESQLFSRNLLVDLPFRLDDQEAFASDSLIRDLVREWQTDLPISSIEDEGWHVPGGFYVHVGTEDSFGSSLPPGSTAFVEPISRAEQERPNPNSIYLLQFGNGYRCNKCVVTHGKLMLLVPQHRYVGPQEFTYPGAVRIAGKVRMFAVNLPVPEYPRLDSLPPSSHAAPLVLPWEHLSRDHLFSAKHRRFARHKREQSEIRSVLQSVFASQLTPRTERRYRRPSASQPHVDSLIQMAIANTTRYSDALRATRSLPSDRGRFSLDTLLRAQVFADVVDVSRRAQLPMPEGAWKELQAAYGAWPASFSERFPRPHVLGERAVRLSYGAVIRGVSPPISPGSFLLLDRSRVGLQEMQDDAKDPGWSRPIYALRKGASIVCGYLRHHRESYALVGDPRQETVARGLEPGDLLHLRRVTGIAVPV